MERGRIGRLFHIERHGPRFEAEQLAESVWKVDVNPLLERRLGRDWEARIMHVALQAPEARFEGGAVRTSAAPDYFVTVYNPTNGLEIARQLPELVKLYRREFTYIVRRLSGNPTATLGKDLEHSLNINLTMPPTEE